MRWALSMLFVCAACGSSPPGGAVVVGSTPWGSLDLETENTCAWRDALGLILQVRASPELEGETRELNIIVRADPAAQAGFEGDVIAAARMTPPPSGAMSEFATNGSLSVGRAKDQGGGGVRFEGTLRMQMAGFDLEVDIDAGGCMSNPS